MTTWQNELKTELEAVQKGLKESEKDTTKVDAVLAGLNDNTTEAEAIKLLANNELGYFVGMLVNGQLHTRVELKNNPPKVETEEDEEE